MENEPLERVGVCWDVYMEQYAHDFYEWVDGTVIKMSPIHARHNEIQSYLMTLLNTYFELKPVGRLEQAPFVMTLPTVNTSREPDIQVILNENMDAYTSTGMMGAADIVIEIVSPESVSRDYEDKFAEYQRGGVPEYWLIDPLKSEARFYQLSTDGAYTAAPLTAGVYTTQRLPGLRVNTSLLWQETLPGPVKIVAAVTAMLAE